MASDDFIGGVVSQFKDKLAKESDKSVKLYISQYKEKLNAIETTNKKLMEETFTDYHKQRQKLADSLNKSVSDMVTNAKKDLNAEVSKKAGEMDQRLATIDDELFNDPNKLYQKIVAASEELKNQRKEFEKERKEWTADDIRCAEWLGIPYESKAIVKSKAAQSKDDVKYDGLDDEEEPNSGGSKNQKANKDGTLKEKISDEDFITIKVDDRTFRTYRGTLTQVTGSFMQKLFGPHHDMIHRDNDGVYYLNCNPDTFGKILDILRKRGAVPIDFKMTPKLYSALVEYGILEAFFPSFNVSELAIGVDIKKKPDFHVLFQSFRSSENNGNYLRWNVAHLSNIEKEEEKEEKKDDDVATYWQLNANDNSEIMILKTGWYRVVFRCCINYSGSSYAAIYVGGSAKYYSYHYNTNSNHNKSYNFNDVLKFNEGDKLRFYAGTAANKETKASYLCIETIPESILSSVAVWTSTATDSYYRQWNSTVKSSGRYSLSNSNKNVNIQQGGLYRISARLHTNYSTGNGTMTLYENRNGSNKNFYNYQSSATTGNECHMYDELALLKKGDYIHLYDNNHGTNNSNGYQQLQMLHIPFSHVIGCWRAGSVKDTYIRVWSYEHWCNNMLYELSNDKATIEVKESGYYRISAHLTNSQPSGQGHSSLFIDGNEYCVSRMGCYNGTWNHTTSIQEIIKLRDGAKLHFYSTKPTTSQDRNSLFIEKLL